MEQQERFGAARLRVNKTYKMYVGGAFVRSESGRCFAVQSDKRLAGSDLDVVNIPQGSRKDVRDAVVAARAAQEAWAGRTAYNRGQILYRLAEVLEARRDELRASLERGGSSAEDARVETDLTIDRTVYYAGFSDKVASLLASSNPVSGPHFAFSIPEPTGVVGLVAPPSPALLGLVSMVLPVLVGGNAAIAVASAMDPRSAILLAECMATSDFPGALVQVLTGFAEELAPVLASHREVAALVLCSDNPTLRSSVEAEGSASVKRVFVSEQMPASYWREEAQGLGWVERCMETKSIWHPRGI